MKATDYSAMFGRLPGFPLQVHGNSPGLTRPVRGLPSVAFPRPFGHGAFPVGFPLQSLAHEKYLVPVTQIH